MQLTTLVLLLPAVVFALPHSSSSDEHCKALHKRAGGQHSPLAAAVMHNNMASEAEKHWWEVFLSGCGQNRRDEMERQGVKDDEQLKKLRKVEPVRISDKYSRK